jgi:hypothetical protein
MSVEETLTIPPLFSFATIISFAEIAIILLAFCYFIFSLIVVRQVNLMTETVITETGPVFRAFAIIHSGIALGIVILFIGFFFG